MEFHVGNVIQYINSNSNGIRGLLMGDIGIIETIQEQDEGTLEAEVRWQNNNVSFQSFVYLKKYLKLVNINVDEVPARKTWYSTEGHLSIWELIDIQDKQKAANNEQHICNK